MNAQTDAGIMMHIFAIFRRFRFANLSFVFSIKMIAKKSQNRICYFRA